MTGADDSLLGIHLIGPGYGENIIIELPDGRVGVIDCHRPGRSKTRPPAGTVHPTLSFLESKKVERLAFVALTHPHEDHGRGMRDLLERFANQLDEVWMFRAWDTAVYLEKCCVARKKKLKQHIKDRIKREPDSFAYELLRIRHLVLKECCDPKDAERAELREFHSNQTYHYGQVSVRFLGPNQGTAAGYVGHICQAVENALEKGCENWHEADANHNILSPAILLEFGQTRILLGGDMERQAWEEAIATARNNDISLKSHFIKISHHGSRTGLTPGMYRQMTIPSKSLAALTPCRKGRNRLPDRHGIAEAYPCMTELFATHAAAAAEGTNRHSYPTVPPEWAERLQQQPGLSALLNKDVCTATFGDGDPCDSLPAEWVRDIQERPSLAASLAEQVVEGTPGYSHDGRTLEDTCRVSFFFDADGREILERRYIGEEASRLDWHGT